MTVLQAGGGFGIYPEGTRSRDGRLARGKTGVAWLALTADCPVVPVGVTGTDRIQPIGASWPRPHRFSVDVRRSRSPSPSTAARPGNEPGPARGDRHDHGGDRRAVRPGEGRLVTARSAVADAAPRISSGQGIGVPSTVHT